MRACVIGGVFFGLFLLAGTRFTRADDADEIHKIMANALRERAADLANQGLHERAITFSKAAKQIEMSVEGRESGENRLAGLTDEPQLMKRLQDLLDKQRRLRQADAPEAELTEVQEQITGIKNELKAAHARRTARTKHSIQARASTEPLGTAARISHLHTAVQHLQRAEADELARQAKDLYDRVKEEWDEELRRRREARGRTPHSGEHGLDGMQALRADLKKALGEIEQLRAEVKALRQQVEER